MVVDFISSSVSVFSLGSGHEGVDDMEGKRCQEASDYRLVPTKAKEQMCAWEVEVISLNDYND